MNRNQRWLQLIISIKQEAFEKCWAHSPLRAASPIHQVSLAVLSRAACASMSTTTTTTTRDRGDRYGPMHYYVDVGLTESVSSVLLPSSTVESNSTAVSLPSVSRSVMSSPYTVLTTGKPSDHAFVQLQPQPAHQVCWFV